jgi:HEAT repeat protein
MNIEQLTMALSLQSERNNALRFLESLVVDVDERLVDCLVKIISEPTSVDDTNRFASLLVDLGAEPFIAPLIESISRATVHESRWLADYMYALGRLLTDRGARDELYPAEESFVHLLGGWLVSTGGGEISWKAGIIMAELQHPATREYLMRGVADQTLFSRTRIACVGGLMNQYRGDVAAVLSTLSNDPDEDVRDAVADARRHLEKSQAEA